MRNNRLFFDDGQPLFQPLTDLGLRFFGKLWPENVETGWYEWSHQTRGEKVSRAEVARRSGVSGGYTEDEILEWETATDAQKLRYPMQTYGEKYGPAMAITDQAEADACFERLVAHTMGHGKTRQEAEQLERVNLGYYAGYYDHETRDRVERLFRCSHPVFGAIAESGPPTPEEAFRKGLEMGEPPKAG